jgi:uncharacterized membrane protein
MSQAFELMKKDFGNIFVAFLLVIVMSIIPFCGILAVGNFYKYLDRLKRGEQANPGDIFNFDDFMPYFILQLILLAVIAVLYIPMFFIFPLIAMAQYSDTIGFGSVFFMIIYFMFFFFAVIFISTKAFYMPALISLKGVTDFQTAWKASGMMTKGNLLNIFLFVLVTSLVANVGIIACGIGLFVTLPFYYTAQFFAYDDAMMQISHDEISDLGIKEKF